MSLNNFFVFLVTATVIKIVGFFFLEKHNFPVELSGRGQGTVRQEEYGILDSSTVVSSYREKQDFSYNLLVSCKFMPDP